jgi:hypothetical protein
LAAREWCQRGAGNSEFRVFISGTVKDGNVAAFRDLGRRMTEHVAGNEPGTFASLPG